MRESHSKKEELRLYYLDRTWAAPYLVACSRTLIVPDNFYCAPTRMLYRMNSNYFDYPTQTVYKCPLKWHWSPHMVSE